jgi:hypothetical protein
VLSLLCACRASLTSVEVLCVLHSACRRAPNQAVVWNDEGDEGQDVLRCTCRGLMGTHISWQGASFPPPRRSPASSTAELVSQEDRTRSTSRFIRGCQDIRCRRRCARQGMEEDDCVFTTANRLSFQETVNPAAPFQRLRFSLGASGFVALAAPLFSRTAPHA